MNTNNGEGGAEVQGKGQERPEGKPHNCLLETAEEMAPRDQRGTEGIGDVVLKTINLARPAWLSG